MKWLELLRVGLLLGWIAFTAWTVYSIFRTVGRPRRGDCRVHLARAGFWQPANGFRCQRCKRFIAW